MTRVQKLQAELDTCIELSRNAGLPPDVRRSALYRAQSITTERMAITTELVYAGAEAELQQMIIEGPKM